MTMLASAHSIDRVTHNVSVYKDKNGYGLVAKLATGIDCLDRIMVLKFSAEEMSAFAKSLLELIASHEDQT